jgi:uncharacterized protein (UPF0254 family)
VGGYGELKTTSERIKKRREDGSKRGIRVIEKVWKMCFMVYE